MGTIVTNRGMNTDRLGDMHKGSDRVRKRAYSISTLECPECGLKMYVPRPKNKKRANGHIKDIYCVRCGKKTKYVEKGEYK